MVVNSKTMILTRKNLLLARWKIMGVDCHVPKIFDPFRVNMIFIKGQKGANYVRK
jgi:hypothetical protein